jgi:hypothetical protein
MNDLQHIDERRYGPVLLTLNPPSSPDPSTVQARFHYDHPILDAAAIQTQRRMHLIQGTGGISYAGAWLNFGFHEDGWTSGLLATTKYAPILAGGIRLPWEIEMVEGSSWSNQKATSVKQGGIIVGLLANVFDLLEWSGFRGLVGSLIRLFLGAIILLLNMVLPRKVELD